jgi:ElaB/YqjD/DUF883 family membrane-anchored ribosome-binding protein
MTNPDPDRLRRDIERTQHNLSTDVDLLAEKVTPGKIVNRRVGRARQAMTNARDRVMGTTQESAMTVGEYASSMSDKASSAADRAASKASSVAGDARQKVEEVPGAVRRGTEGNPIAAGLIAFGAGWLLATLAPATKQEQRLAGQATDLAREHGQELAQQAGQVADQVKENLREPAQQAVSSVRDTATDAAGTVADEAKGTATDVADRTRQATSNVRENNA